MALLRLTVFVYWNLKVSNLWRNVSTFTEQLKPNWVALLWAISATYVLTCTFLSLFSVINFKSAFPFSNILVCACIVGVADCDMSLHRTLRSERRYNFVFSFNLKFLLRFSMLKLRRYCEYSATSKLIMARCLRRSDPASSGLIWRATTTCLQLWILIV